MSVLIVEDNPVRTKKLRAALVGLSITNIDSAPMAIQWLADHSPTLMFLDHDLHEYSKHGKDSGTGLEVASWMARHAVKFKHTAVIVHSLNEKHAPRIVDALRKAEIHTSRIPFIWDRPEMLEVIRQNVLHVLKSAEIPDKLL